MTCMKKMFKFYSKTLKENKAEFLTMKDQKNMLIISKLAKQPNFIFLKKRVNKIIIKAYNKLISKETV